MTAIDVTMAKALVTLLDAESFSVDVDAVYARDGLLRLETLTGPVLFVDSTLTHERLARGVWGKNVTLQVLAAKPQSESGENGNAAAENEKDSWLAFIDDELIEAIKTSSVSNRLPSRITFQQRLDPNRLRDQSLFFTKFQITYLLA